MPETTMTVSEIISKIRSGVSLKISLKIKSGTHLSPFYLEFNHEEQQFVQTWLNQSQFCSYHEAEQLIRNNKSSLYFEYGEKIEVQENFCDLAISLARGLL